MLCKCKINIVNRMKVYLLSFLFCLVFFFKEAIGQNIEKTEWPPDFEKTLREIGGTYIPHQHYSFTGWSNHGCDDTTCPLRRLGILHAILTHKDGQCQIMIFLGGPVPHAPQAGHPNTYAFDRIRSDFGYGGVTGSASRFDREDLRMMLNYYPQDSAKAIFNADFMLSYPFDMRRQKHDHNFTRTRVIVTGKNGYDIFLYFVLTNQGMLDFDKYLSDFRQTLWFED